MLMYTVQQQICKNIRNFMAEPHILYQPNDIIKDFESFKFKAKITGRTSAPGNTKNVEIVAPFKYLITFGRTLEMPPN